MVDGRPTGVFRRIVKIKPGEKKLAALTFAYFFLIAAPYTIINALRTSNFLFKEGVGWLPVVYLLAFLATGLVVFLHSRLQDRWSIQAWIVPSLVFFAVSGVLIQWGLETEFGRRSPFLNFFFWVWSSVLIVVLITGFWTTVNEIYDPRQARRLMVFLNSGGILGSILGGLLVLLLSEGAWGAALMPLACAMLVGCVWVVAAVFRQHPSRLPGHGRGPAEGQVLREARAPFRRTFRAVRKEKFLVLIAAIVAIGIIVSTCIEFQFLSAAYGHFENQPQARLQAFFGVFEAAMTVLAFFLNILMAGCVLKKLTAPRTMLLTPVVLLACSAGLLLIPFGLFAGIFIRGVDEGLAFAVNHPFREIMYIPVPAHLRHRAKAFIEMFVGQFAKVAGAVVLLLFAVVLNKKLDFLTPRFDPGLARYLSLVVIGFLVPWIVLALKAGKAYISVIKENIQPLWDPPEHKMTQVDVEHAKLVFDTIDSRSYSSALYGLHLFDLLARDKLTPELKRIIAGKAGEVWAKAISDRLEPGSAAFFPTSLEDPLPKDIMTEIPIILSSEEYQRLMKSYAASVIDKGQGSEVSRMELAKAIGMMGPDSLLAGDLTQLIEDPSPKVSGLALKSAARLGREEHIPAIIRTLAVPVLVEDAVDALRGYGDKAAGALERCLLDRAADLRVRKGVVEVLGRIGTRRALRSLTEELEYGRGELDGRILEVLAALRMEKGTIPLSASAARRKTYALIGKFCRDFLDLHREGPGTEGAALRPDLARDLGTTFANIFKLLGLYYPQADIRRAYQNIVSGSRHSLAHAVEWLDNALDKDLHDLVMPLVDDLSLQEKSARFRKIIEDVADR